MRHLLRFVDLDTAFNEYGFTKKVRTWFLPLFQLASSFTFHAYSDGKVTRLPRHRMDKATITGNTLRACALILSLDIQLTICAFLLLNYRPDFH